MKTLSILNNFIQKVNFQVPFKKIMLDIIFEAQKFAIYFRNAIANAQFEHRIYCLFDRNTENSHFSTLTYLAVSGRNHDISTQMRALSLS